jgi:hypothetical protein
MSRFTNALLDGYECLAAIALQLASPIARRCVQLVIPPFAIAGASCAGARASLDIRAELALGSRARTDHPDDQWSDLDHLLITTACDLITVTRIC